MAGWDAEVAVVGLGAWGASALWQLAARGIEAVGLDRHEPGHPFGSSHGGSRMFRVTCLEHPHLVPLARRSLELWHQLEQAHGQQLFVPAGGLLIGPEDGLIAGGTLRAARVHGIEVETLTPALLRERFPRQAALPADHIGVWEPSAGILRPEESVRAAVGLARAAGARVHTGTRVDAIELVPGGALVRTAQTELRVRQVVVAAGAWLGFLVPGLPVETYRMPITWFRPRAGHEDGFGLADLPVFMREIEGGRVLWGNGAENGHDVKLGLEEHGRVPTPLDPLTDDRAVRPEDWTELGSLLPEKLPGLADVPSKVAVCMYAKTPDGQFVIGRPGGDSRLVVAGGCNAHGFKHATGIGELLADLVQHKPAAIDAGFLSPDRF
ncbi:N-methyl-L-tryptophan oxidase [Streptomyces sp. NPDC058960]|uniref:N-methyl-L-tryptophan oxidase n=1 Tax=Streptomyces sp. NPDC058960 TaxID=3346679 RepID=UPI0036A31E6A